MLVNDVRPDRGIQAALMQYDNAVHAVWEAIGTAHYGDSLLTHARLASIDHTMQMLASAQRR